MNWYFPRGRPRVWWRRRRQHAAGRTLRIEVVAAGFEVTDDLRGSVERCLLFSLSRFGPGVERVVVRLSDTANPLGGFDRRCRMRAWLRRHESVRVEALDGPFAIERAVERLTKRVEWVLVNGRAETESLLTPGAPRAKADERVAPGSPPASRARRTASVPPAPGKKPRK